MCLTIFCMVLGYAHPTLHMNLHNIIMHTYTCPHRSAALHYRLGPRTCPSWSQCWYCRGHVYHHLPGVFLYWSPAGCTHHLLLLCEEKGEEQWTATSLHLRGPPTCPTVWWGGSRQAGGERKYGIWSSGHTGDEPKSLIWSCATLDSLECCNDSVDHVDAWIFLSARLVIAF